MSKFFNSTTYTDRHGAIQDVVWSNRCQKAALAHIKAQGGKDVKTVKMALHEFPCMLTTADKPYFFKDDELTIVPAEGGIRWLCFSPEAVKFVRQLEGCAA